MKRYMKCLPLLLIAAVMLIACQAAENADTRYDMSAPPEVQIFPPQNQDFDEDFTEAFTEFKRVVSYRDYENIGQFLDQNTATSPDPDQPTGWDEFFDAWAFNYYDPASSALWPALEEIIRHGGLFDVEAKTFMAPYMIFACPDELKDSNSDYGFILVDEDVNMYESKDVKSKILAKLSYNFVYLDRDERGFSDKAPSDLVKINTLGGVEGYIEKRHMWSLMDFRLELHETEEGWKLKYLVTGKEIEWMMRNRD